MREISSRLQLITAQAAPLLGTVSFRVPRCMAELSGLLEATDRASTLRGAIFNGIQLLHYSTHILIYSKLHVRVHTTYSVLRESVFSQSLGAFSLRLALDPRPLTKFSAFRVVQRRQRVTSSHAET